jgi:hypothetical protein
MDSFVWLHPDIADTGPGIYWRQTFSTLAATMSKHTGDPLEASFDRISSSVASVEAGAYHSKRLPRAWFFELPSSNVAGIFARDVLRPRAQAGECFILVWRRARFWQIGAEANIIVRPPSRAQGRYLENNERASILQHILRGG